MNEQFLPTNLAALEPKEQQEVLQEIAEEFSLRYREDQKELVERGALTFVTMKPRELLQALMGETLPEDLPHILNENYLLERRLGAAPPLTAELLTAEREAMLAQHQLMATEAEMMGGEPPPMPEMPPEVPFLWVGLLPHEFRPASPYDDYFWTFYQKRLITLLKEQGEREDEGA